MADLSREERRKRGVAYALVMRLNNERLPRALALRDQVNRGERLSDYDKRYLKRILSEASSIRRAADNKPEYEKLVAQMSALYDEISRKGLENEQRPEPPQKPPDAYS